MKLDLFTLQSRLPHLHGYYYLCALVLFLQVTNFLLSILTLNCLFSHLVWL